MLSRWPVLISVPLAAEDCDDQERMTDAAIERVFGAARAAYFEQCTTVDRATSEIVGTSIRRGAATVPSRSVTVSASVVEIFPESFTMEARIRTEGSDDVVADARCSVLLGGGVTDSIRDEFIALAHGARHFH
jgi:acyl-CoA thioesterase FadM